MDFNAMTDELLKLGATRAAYLPADQIPFQPSLRKYCENNRCGSFGKNYMCPPLVGPIDKLIERAKKYENGLIFQLVSPLEDSFDVEGMEAAAQNFDRLLQKIADYARKECKLERILLLGAGGCRQCEKCAALTHEPCRHPEYAFSSLEAYGIHVATLLGKVNIPYINGENTVSYAGVLLFS